MLLSGVALTLYNKPTPTMNTTALPCQTGGELQTDLDICANETNGAGNFLFSRELVAIDRLHTPHLKNQGHALVAHQLQKI